MEKIYIAVISGALLWYMKSCYTEAMRMKLAAARIRAYTVYWKRLAIDSEFYSIYQTGEQWSQTERKVMASGKAEEQLEIRKKIKEILKENILKLVKDEKLFEREHRDKFMEKMIINEALISGDNKKFFIDETNKIVDRILDEKLFITEEDGSCLGVYTASTTLSLKMEMIKLITKASHLIIGLSEDKVPNEHLEEILIELAYTSTSVSKSIETLLYCAQEICEEHSIKLTIRRMLFQW